MDIRVWRTPFSLLQEGCHKADSLCLCQSPHPPNLRTATLQPRDHRQTHTLSASASSSTARGWACLPGRMEERSGWFSQGSTSCWDTASLHRDTRGPPHMHIDPQLCAPKQKTPPTPGAPSASLGPRRPPALEHKDRPHRCTSQGTGTSPRVGGHTWWRVCYGLNCVPRPQNIQASLVAHIIKNPSAMQETRVHWVRKIPWRRAQQPTPVSLPGEAHGQRSPRGGRVRRD